MQPLISVIVPIYKVESYLHQCVDSILSQTHSNLEIILVDDGSPDRCGAICDEYAAKDPRVKSIHKENGGLSDARNAGLDIATGDFYYFVDSDDMLPAHSVSTMLDLAIKHKSDLVIGGFERFRDDTGEIFFSTDADGVKTHVYTQEEAVKDFYRDGCQAWAVLYKRAVHENIRFPKGEINEDEAIIFKILENCSTVVVTNRVVYSYRNRENSITTTSFSEKKFVWYHHCVANLHWIQTHYPQYEAFALHRVCASLLWSAREIALSDKAFPHIQQTISVQIRKNRGKFLRLPQVASAARIRLYLLSLLPFGIYRVIERFAARHISNPSKKENRQ